MIRALSAILFAALTQGCAATFALDDFTPFSPPRGEKHQAAVELCYRPGLATTVVRVEITDTFDAYLGPTLIASAESTARAAFADVRVRPLELDDPAGDRARLLLRFVGTATDLPSRFAFADGTTTLELEWTLQDRAGQAIWVGTLLGTGIANVGNAFSAPGNAEERFQLALDDAFAKSLEALRTAPEIRAWAASGS